MQYTDLELIRTIQKIIEVLGTFAFAISGSNTIARDPMIVVGAVIKGSAIPDTFP